MSEFSEIMRQARRMCETFRDGNCSKCPIGNAKALECGITVTSEMDCKEVERRVMQWAKEHPEPVYPSWEEGWKQLFPEAKSIPCLSAFGINECSGFNSCIKCKNQPMPADIAEKLGIKPIAPEKPAPEHDGCEGCKWCSKTEKDEPCVNCRGTSYRGGDEKPDLWEAADKNVT